MKTDFPADITARSLASPEGLERKQRQLFDLIIGHYRNVLAGENPSQLFINLDGKAGTGKSHVIMLISATLDEMAQSAGINKSPVVRAAPTGVAAYGISGCTLHSMFHLLPVGRGNAVDLNTENLHALQANFRGVRYLIIDEKSMIGLKQLHWINDRCQQIFPATSPDDVLPFGGLNVVLAGDFYQLPPVAQRALFDTRPLQNLEEIHGRSLYRSFATTIELDVVRRQEGTDQRAEAFREALEHLREDEITHQGWRLLCFRVQSVVPQEIPMFNDAIHIYARKHRSRNSITTVCETLDNL
ncbi:hypothetical protein Egran_03865 [Elaphomyces granulatus]|uniref:ATP-dependent DNA helicase n=1 Tax=Elaphomyces granulatus TaxID=519963 RepID=A0A232LW41_9EURO|nr:hypothetical protein Egran_03865 [Elaphomyces granulatus]